MVAFPPPPVTLRQRSSTFAEPLCSLRRVLASGCHPFLFEWLEKVSQPSLAEPFGSDSGVIESTAACLFSLSRVTTQSPSLCRSRRPQPSRQELYTPRRFLDQIFVCFIFFLIENYFCAAVFFNTAAIFSRTASISSLFLYFVRGQKKPFKPSFFRRGTT